MSSSEDSGYSSAEKAPAHKKEKKAVADEVDIGSEDSDDDYDSAEDFYMDEDTGQKVTEKQVRESDKEAFEMLHRLLYGGRPLPVPEKAKPASKKRSARDSGSDTESYSSGSESDSVPEKKKARKSSLLVVRKPAAARKPKSTASKAKKASPARSKGKPADHE